MDHTHMPVDRGTVAKVILDVYVHRVACGRGYYKRKSFSRALETENSAEKKQLTLVGFDEGSKTRRYL